MQKFRKRLRQPVRQRLGHDGVVVIVVRLEFLDQFLQSMPAGNGESANMIIRCWMFDVGCSMFRRDEVGETPVRCAISLFDLLAEEMKFGQNLCPRFVRVKLHVVAHPVRREETINTVRPDQFLADDLIQQLLRVGKQLARLLAVFLMLKNLRIHTAQFPGVEKRRPVNERNEVFQFDP